MLGEERASRSSGGAYLFPARDAALEMVSARSRSGGPHCRALPASTDARADPRRLVGGSSLRTLRRLRCRETSLYLVVGDDDLKDLTAKLLEPVPPYGRSKSGEWRCAAESSTSGRPAAIPCRVGLPATRSSRSATSTRRPALDRRSGRDRRASRRPVSVSRLACGRAPRGARALQRLDAPPAGARSTRSSPGRP